MNENVKNCQRQISFIKELENTADWISFDLRVNFFVSNTSIFYDICA